VNGVAGLEKGAMVRWFNTNTFYFTPVVKGELNGDGNAVWKRIDRRLVKRGEPPFRAVLPDPLTLAELSEDRYYGGVEKLMFAFADKVLSREVRSLDRNGIKYVQFSSPSLVARFRDRPVSNALLGQLGEALRTTIKGTSLRTGFHTFFGDASPYFPSLFDVIPTDDIGLDFTQTDPDDLVSTRKGIIAGISDGRTTYLEGVGDLIEKVELVTQKTGTKRITLSPSCDLRFIPRTTADEKLRVLSSLKGRLVAA
jgi:5-methyltetrahydropteroyltriglutamate--homocysteine methyltransferase